MRCVCALVEALPGIVTDVLLNILGIFQDVIFCHALVFC